MWKSPKPERSRPRICGELPVDSGFDARDERLAFCLARGMTRLSAAKDVGLSDRTVYARLTNPKFRHLVTQCRARILDEAVGLLAAAGNEAVEELRKLVKDEKSEIRLRAACAILDQTIRLGTYSELSVRIAELERRIDVRPGS